MKRVLILLTILMLLAACSAKTDNPQENSDATTEQIPSPSGTDVATTTETGSQTTNDNTLPTSGTTPSTPVKEPEQPKEVVPMVTFIELGAESCIPCKMMQPIMREITSEYKGLVKVVFYDLYKDRQAGQKYGVRVMPTQVFLDKDGREFFRHEGFYPKEELERMLAEKGGVTKPK